MTVIVPGGGWAWFWSSFGSLLLLDLAVVSLVVIFALTATQMTKRRARLDADRPSSARPPAWRLNPMATMVAEGVLAELYARGDITEGVYRERLTVLRSTDQPPPDKT